MNWRAIAALVLAVLPVLPGFVRAATTPGGQVADPTFLDTLYTYAWFVTFALSAVIYLALMRGQDELGGLDLREPEALFPLLRLREIGQAQRHPNGVAGAADDDLPLAFFHAGWPGRRWPAGQGY